MAGEAADRSLHRAVILTVLGIWWLPAVAFLKYGWLSEWVLRSNLQTAGWMTPLVLLGGIFLGARTYCLGNRRPGAVVVVVDLLVLLAYVLLRPFYPPAATGGIGPVGVNISAR